MAKIPGSPEEIFDEFRSDVKTVFGDHLLSIILYGSGARGEYVRKKSDINFCVILSEEGIQRLASAFDLVKKWRKRHVATPLFLTQAYIDSSLDSFPLEFLNMKESYKVVYGLDVLDSLEIAKKHIRLECEEQIKGKLLHLRERFLSTFGKKRALLDLFSITIPAFVSIFRGMLVLKDIDPPTQTKLVLQQAAETFDLDAAVFAQILAVRERRAKLTQDEAIHLGERYIKEIRKCAILVDKL